ncbi:hypothetical protein J6590_066721 [Homalodisca vitripennis]|nr:hypothetical protein J6590_066721 [Homalodisca vitripennis]
MDRSQWEEVLMKINLHLTQKAHVLKVNFLRDLDECIKVDFTKMKFLNRCHFNPPLFMKLLRQKGNLYTQTIRKTQIYSSPALLSHPLDQANWWRQVVLNRRTILYLILVVLNPSVHSLQPSKKLSVDRTDSDVCNAGSRLKYLTLALNGFFEYSVILWRGRIKQSPDLVLYLWILLLQAIRQSLEVCKTDSEM